MIFEKITVIQLVVMEQAVSGELSEIWKCHNKERRRFSTFTTQIEVRKKTKEKECECVCVRAHKIYYKNKKAGSFHINCVFLFPH